MAPGSTIITPPRIACSLICYIVKCCAAGTKRGPYVCGNMFEENFKMVRFVPGLDRNGFTDPSYHLPAFYELWARWGPAADRAFWSAAAAASREFFQKATNPVTGLAPDYANFDGTPYSLKWNSGAANFRFDAWRTAMDWSVDWAWWAKDPRERELSDRIQTFFASQGYGDLRQRFYAGWRAPERHACSGPDRH